MPRPRATRLLYAAATLSLLAAILHAWVMPEHLFEWWGYGTVFLATAVFQALYALALARHPRPWLYRLGIAVNLAIIALWVWTRTVGIPLLGPGAGETEPVGRLDVVSKVAEAGLVALLAALLWRAGRARSGAGHHL